ncbi:hypothetical protein [Thermaerobacter sp. PB12/4term]|uniref:hypothetical protein n=1 Tax=Thermaerobacter sp. PB12/4term TaxID=2293838 RepID=UPI001FAC92F0|nr:hypothetical protein [Thermaerobacter sp. PB12/4term]
MARRRLMSEALREELARELGVFELAARHGWGAVPARECGRLVQQAVLRAETLLAQQEGRSDAPVIRQQGAGLAPHALSPQVPPFVQNPSPWPGPWPGHAAAAARPWPAHTGPAQPSGPGGQSPAPQPAIAPLPAPGFLGPRTAAGAPAGLGTNPAAAGGPPAAGHPAPPQPWRARQPGPVVPAAAVVTTAAAARGGGPWPV